MNYSFHSYEGYKGIVFGGGCFCSVFLGHSPETQHDLPKPPFLLIRIFHRCSGILKSTRTIEEKDQ